MQISVLQDAIFRVVAAILHLGNVEFAEGSEADSSVPKDEKSQFHLKTAAELFMYIIYVTLLFRKFIYSSFCVPYMDTFWHSAGAMKKVSRNLCVSVLWQHVGRVLQKI